MRYLRQLILKTGKTGLSGKAEVTIRSSPEKVYQLVSDVTRMGEWSPECYRCEWLDGALGPTVGARFRGHNRRNWLMRWQTTARITEAEPGKAFAFEIFYGRDKVQTRWRYEMKPMEGGTLLTESFEGLWYIRIVMLTLGGVRHRKAEIEEGIRRTLERIKAIAEAGLEP